ncbi:MAG: hypothetical protein H6R12_49 [Proteobacteria bacterium]|nr:hypothetical protein [Pseudomonadota bacterium]
MDRSRPPAVPDTTLEPSKSQRKREMHALQDMGEQLVELSAERLAQMALPDELRDAVREAQRITKHGGRRRQMQFIGRLMRSIDVEPIREALAAIEGRSAVAFAPTAPQRPQGTGTVQAAAGVPRTVPRAAESRSGKAASRRRCRGRAMIPRSRPAAAGL